MDGVHDHHASHPEGQALSTDKELWGMIPEDFRQYVIILAVKTILVSETHRSNPSLLSVTERMRRSGRVNSVHYVGMKIIDGYQVKAKALQPKAESVTHNGEQSEVLAMIGDAIASGASDCHLTVNQEKDRFEIRFRCNGDLDVDPRHFTQNVDAESGMAFMRCIYQAMTDVAGAHFSTQEPQDASMKRSLLPDSLFGVRVAHTPILGGHYMVCRLLNRPKKKLTFEGLGFHPDQVATLQYLMRIPSGIILVAGVTGSGKSTTLAASLDQLYKLHNGTINIVTVEDPVEFIIEGAHQIPVTDDGVGRVEAYKRAARAMMRLDPDVAMFSELRDDETVGLAISLSLTGHQVWSTIHAIDVVSILPRLEMMGSSRSVLADNKLITGLMSHSLVKKLCPHCSISLASVGHNVDSDRIYRSIMLAGLNVDRVKLRGPGCEHCKGGYVGRTVIAEVVVPDAKYMQYFLAGDRIQMRRHAFGKEAQGFMSRFRHAHWKIEAGEVDPRDVEAQIGPLNKEEVEQDDMITRHEIIRGI